MLRIGIRWTAMESWRGGGGRRSRCVELAVHDKFGETRLLSWLASCTRRWLKESARTLW